MTPAIFITGGATGIGAATVARFRKAGWNAAFTDINDKEAEQLARDTGALFIHADTRSYTETEAAVATAEKEYGNIKALFANAGIHRRNSILDITEEEFDLVIKTNIYGTFHTLRAAVPAIIRSGGGLWLSTLPTKPPPANATASLTDSPRGHWDKSPRASASTCFLRECVSMQYAPERYEHHWSTIFFGA